jgi:PAS domain S-box-containing protein
MIHSSEAKSVSDHRTAAPVRDRVLLVDDEEQVLVALEDLLSEHFTVLKTQSGEEALEIAAERPDIAVVISDQRMPRMTGDQFLNSLVKFSVALRILVTGFGDLTAITRAVNNGRIFAYIAKPWKPEELLFKVQTAAAQFRLERELMHERQLLHDLMNNAPDGVYFKDADLRFLRANKSFAQMLDQSDPRTLVGKRIGEIEPSPIHAIDIEHEERGVLSGQKALTDVTRQYEFGQEEHWLSETKAPIRAPDGRPLGVVGIVRDVTRQRLLEAQLAQSQRLEAIGRFAGGVAHDFNNLLAVILSYVELSSSQLEPESPIVEDLAQAIDAAHRGAALTRQLLAFSRRQVIQPRPLQINDVVRNLEKILRRVIGEDIVLSVVAPDVGTIVADGVQIEQILLNLTVNARDAMPDGGRLVIETANVTLDASYTDDHAGVEPGEFVVVSVTDTGSGMDAATQKRIFEPFFSTKEPGKGTGLGLATVYGIVTQSGGHISVYSELAVGTAFKVYFPRVDVVPEPEARHSDIIDLRAPNGNILLLEDDDSVRRVAARILTSKGYTVLEAREPAQARTLFHKYRASLDLFLTDLVLPGSNGIALSEEFLRSLPGLRVLFMSGYPGGAVQEARLTLKQPYIEKPFTPRSLTAKVREVLSSPQDQ